MQKSLTTLQGELKVNLHLFDLEEKNYLNFYFILERNSFLFIIKGEIKLTLIYDLSYLLLKYYFERHLIFCYIAVLIAFDKVLKIVDSHNSFFDHFIYRHGKIINIYAVK